jgi:hypothetical protein
MPNNRCGKKWTIPELLSLQREYELLELTIKEIAIKHKRSQAGILSKLEAEGFIESWGKARGFDILEYQRLVLDDLNDINVEENDSDSDSENDDDSDDGDYIDEQECEDDCEDDTEEESEHSIEFISDRVWGLENRLNEIGVMVSKIFDKVITRNQITQSCQN